MASKMIGRADCPECGFTGAHVKESEKCQYRYCPECGAQHHAKTERQRADLAKKTRTLEPTPSPTPSGKDAPAPAKPATPSPTPSTPTPSPTPPTPTPTKKSPLFGF